MNYDKEDKKPRKDPKLIKIGQLRSRSLSPKDADNRARESEDLSVIMENKRIDSDKERKKQRNKGASEE